LVLDAAVLLCPSDACRLAPTNPEFLLTTEDCAQAASVPAPTATTNSRMIFRTRAAETRDASGIGFALVSTHEVPAQSMEDISHPQSVPPTEDPHQELNPMRAEPWPDQTRHGIEHAISVGCDYCATGFRRARRIRFNDGSAAPACDRSGPCAPTRREDDDGRACSHPVKEIDDILVGHADAAG
jgi:hypothetical protein